MLRRENDLYYFTGHASFWRLVEYSDWVWTEGRVGSPAGKMRVTVNTYAAPYSRIAGCIYTYICGCGKYSTWLYLLD